MRVPMGSDFIPDADLALPDIALDIVEDVSPANAPGFLRLVRRRLVARYPDGSISPAFPYDEVDRRAIDAVIIAAHFMRGNVPWVYLRSALRPPLFFRDPGRSPVPESGSGSLWELPAGLIEPDEQTESGVFEAARRELAEELGFDVAASGFRALGPSTLPAAGFIAERHFFVSVEVRPEARGEPSLDGSALERFGRVVALPLSQAVDLCRTGRIEDAKTELGLRRLVDALARSTRELAEARRPRASSPGRCIAVTGLATECGMARASRTGGCPLPRSLEFVTLFVILPGAFAALLGVYGQGWLLLPGLWVLALACLAILLRDGGFVRAELSRFPEPEARSIQLRRMLRRFIPALVGMAAATLVFAPEAWLELPRRQPALWLLVLVAYPLLSALPQGLVWRVFFVHRYATLFRTRGALLAAGALSFAFAHLIFQNVLAVVATAIGGALFLQTYLASRSMLLATLEHAAYGAAAFTLGFGRFLYHGSIAVQ